MIMGSTHPSDKISLAVRSNTKKELTAGCVATAVNILVDIQHSILKEETLSYEC